MKGGNDESSKDHELDICTKGEGGREEGFDGPTSDVTVKSSSFGCNSRQHRCTIFWSWVVASQEVIVRAVIEERVGGEFPYLHNISAPISSRLIPSIPL